MGHHFVNRVFRFFPSSFTSCQFRSVPDVIESSIRITTKNTKSLHHYNQPPKTSSNLQKNSSMFESHEPKILKNDHKKGLLLGSDAEGRRCPPVTPVSVLAPKKKERAKEIVTKMNNSSSSNSGGWFSSDDEEAEFDAKSDTFFSLSSCSSESFRRKTAKTIGTRFDSKFSTESGRCSSALSAYSVNPVLSQCNMETTNTHTKSARNRFKACNTGQRRERNHGQFVMDSEILKHCEVSEASTELYYNGLGSHHCRKTSKSRRKTVKNQQKKKGSIVVDGGGVEGSYAVERSSNDPYNDFRTSMVEMIIEKQIFEAKELEKLLDCFLSLNSPYYHRAILEVFTEICDILFAS